MDDLRERVLAEIDDDILNAGGKGPETTRLLALRARISTVLDDAVQMGTTLTVPVLATALNGAQIRGEEISVGRDLRVVARRVIEHLPAAR